MNIVYARRSTRKIKTDHYWARFFTLAINIFTRTLTSWLPLAANELTQWNRVLPQKLIVEQLVKTFFASYGTSRFVTVFTNPRLEPDRFGPHPHTLFDHVTNCGTPWCCNNFSDIAVQRVVRLTRNRRYVSSPLLRAMHTKWMCKIWN